MSTRKPVRRSASAAKPAAANGRRPGAGHAPGQGHTFTFSTGYSVTIHPVSPWVMDEIEKGWLEDHPEPEPPTKEVEGLDGPVEVEDRDDPGYLKELQEWERQRSDLRNRLMLELGVECEPDDAVLDRKLESMRKLGAKIGKDLDRKSAWVLYVCIGGAGDYWSLVKEVVGLTNATEEEIMRLAARFQGTVPGHQR